MPIMASIKYILTYLNKSGELKAAPFAKCILDYFGFTSQLKMNIYVELSENKLLLSDQPTNDSQHVKIVHPVFCPMRNLSPEQLNEIPEENLNRGTNVGVSVLVESADEQIFLSRRSLHLRTFPGIWVPPGGHIEENETLEEAGLREFEEEVGIHLSSKDFMNPLKVLALWESTFPAKLTSGLPKRHHIVIYLYGKLSSMTSTDLLKKVQMDASETDACLCLTKDIVQVIDRSREDIKTDFIIPENISKNIRSVVFNEDGIQTITDLDISAMFKRYNERDEMGRVSSGTKMALHEWLKRTNYLPQLPIDASLNL